MNGPPPPYEETPPVSTTTNQTHPAKNATTASNNPYKTRNGIPPQSRRSMEDEARPLPEGWIRQYDSKEHHQFFVDTNTHPPRSIWHHPYDDETYIASIPDSERAQIHGLHRVPTHADIAAESSDDDGHHPPHGSSSHIPTELPPRPQKDDAKLSGVHRFGRRMKDKITATTHEERERMRARRAEEERQMYERHQLYRQAMARAVQTGEPQLIGKDHKGRDVYIEPPNGGYPGVGNGYGYDPYTQGPYARPNAMYMRPQQPYSRPFYGGYGGGMGLPIGLGLGAGLLGGGLLGGALLDDGMFGGGMF